MRSIRRYRLEFQAEITRRVAAKIAASTDGRIRPEEIGECAVNAIIGEDRVLDRRKKAMEQMALKAYHAKKFRYLTDLLAELRHELQDSASRAAAI
jgi:hypothetical protein